jgi:hypothetical protein
MRRRKEKIMMVKAIVHSLKDLDTVEILSHVDNNNVIALYNGVKCTAIFNIFTNCYYVDNIYGIIEEKE